MTEGQRLLYIRKLLGKSQQEFAQLLSVSQAALSDIENGKNGISYPVFKRLVEEIGVHPYWFMWGPEPIFRDSSFEAKYNLSDNYASPSAGANASATPEPTTNVSATPTMAEVMQALSDLKGEVNKMKHSKGKKEK
jgi:transcriptional regulator with XRE-family HTH domain